MPAYRIRCACGAVAEGLRRSRPQALACSGCKGPLFVFPAAPLGTGKRPAPRRLPWRGPLAAAAACAGLLALALAVLWPFLMRKAPPGSEPATNPEIEARIAASRKRLAQGEFHLARAELDAAAALRPPAGAARRLARLRLQADALARLSLVPLEEIVRHARFVRDPDEWAEQWKQHRGRTLVFDDALRRGLDGTPFLANHRVVVDGEEARLALEEVAALRDLPLDDGPRVVFAVRLASCRREQGGAWVVRFAPDHGVLFTDRSALEAASSVPLGDGLNEVLRRQRRWAGR